MATNACVWRREHFIGSAETVEEFQLAFDVWSKKRQCAAADIVPSPGNRVWGALYEVPDFLIERDTSEAQGRKSLDAIEGEGFNYRRRSDPSSAGKRSEPLPLLLTGCGIQSRI